MSRRSSPRRPSIADALLAEVLFMTLASAASAAHQLSPGNHGVRS